MRAELAVPLLLRVGVFETPKLTDKTTAAAAAAPFSEDACDSPELVGTDVDDDGNVYF